MTPRKFAHKILLKWFTSEIYLEHLINFTDSELSAVDRRFSEALIHQVIMHQRMLSFVVGKFVDKKPKMPVYVALLMGTCEILYMQVKDHAAINETVKLVGKVDQRSKGFVNAVLRKVTDYRNTDWEGDRINPRIQAGIRYNIPDWLIKRWSVQFGSETMDLLGSLNERPRKMARVVNSKKRNSVFEKIKEHGVLEEVSSYHPDFAFIHSWQPLLQDDLFTQGKIIPQDVSAIFPVMMISNDNPTSVADVCCAPGGKLTALRQYCPEGTKIRKRTDLRWRRKEEEMPELLKIQHDILENVSQYVKSGGLIVYSTCTFDSEENRGTIKNFLSKHTEFSIEAADPELFPKELIGWKGAIESFPHQHSCEGSFAIALRKC